MDPRPILGRQSIHSGLNGLQHAGRSAEGLAAGADDYIAKPHERGLLRVRLAVAKRHLDGIEKRQQAESTLKESELRFSLFMRNLPGVAFMKDLEGRYIYVNETLCELYQCDPSRFLGRTDFDLWPAEIARALRANDEIAVRSKAPLHAIEHVPLGDAIRHWFVHKFAIMDENDKVMFVAGLGIDTTALRLFEELNRSILENATDGFTLIDTKGKILGQPGLPAHDRIQTGGTPRDASPRSQHRGERGNRRAIGGPGRRGGKDF